MACAVHDPRALPLLGVLAPVQEDTRSYPLHERQDGTEAAAAGDLGLDDGIESPQHLVTVHRSLRAEQMGLYDGRSTGAVISQQPAHQTCCPGWDSVGSYASGGPSPTIEPSSLVPMTIRPMMARTSTSSSPRHRPQTIGVVFIVLSYGS